MSAYTSSYVGIRFEPRAERSFEVVPPAPRVAVTACCSDADIAKALGIDLNTTRNGLFGFDSAFRGRTGAAFAAQVDKTARRVGLDPGLLATNLLAEIQDPATWMKAGPIQSHEVGVDYWDEERPRIRKAVPAAKTIKEKIVRDASGQPLHFINEAGNDTGPIHEFATGADGMLALSCSVAFRDARLRDSLRAGVYDRLPLAVRFAAIRLALNAGLSPARRMVKDAAAGRDPLVRKGPVGPSHPVRTASLRAGQAIHLSCTVFHNVLGCP
jgi:hypothetical protein